MISAVSRSTHTREAEAGSEAASKQVDQKQAEKSRNAEEDTVTLTTTSKPAKGHNSK